jgi:hypothetical protein
MVLLAALLIRRRLWKQYPFFCAYIFFSIADTIVLSALGSHYPGYFMVYWSDQVIYSALGMLALYDVFRHVFRPFCEHCKWFWTIFPATILTVLTASIFWTIQRPPTQAHGMAGVVLSFAVIDCSIELGLFCMFSVLMIVLGIRWRSYACGIIEGFAASALGSLLGFGVRYVLGVDYVPLNRVAPPLGFLVALIFWLNALLRPPDYGVDHLAGKSAAAPEEAPVLAGMRSGALASPSWKHDS